MIGIDRAKIAAIVCDVLSTEVHDLRGREDIEIKSSSVLDDIGIDEVGVTHIVAELEDTFLVAIPDEAIDLMTTKVSDIVELIVSLLRGKAEAAE